MRSFKAPLIISLYCGLLLLIAIATTVVPLSRDTITINTMRSGIEGYIYLIMLQFFLLLLVSPALTAGAISGERERQTLDLLLVTNTGVLKLVFGRVLESFFFLALMIFSSLPVLCLMLAAGGISFVQMLVGLLFLMCEAYAALCVGIFCSSLFKRTAPATVVAYLSVFAIGVLTLLPIISDINRIGELVNASQSAGVALTSLSVLPLAFVMNPLLALVSLLIEQTGLLTGTITQFSYTLYQAFSAMDFQLYAWLGMAFMAVAGTVLAVIGALFIRPNAHGKVKGGHA